MDCTIINNFYQNYSLLVSTFPGCLHPSQWGQQGAFSHSPCDCVSSGTHILALILAAHFLFASVSPSVKLHVIFKGLTRINKGKALRRVLNFVSDKYMLDKKETESLWAKDLSLRG